MRKIVSVIMAILVLFSFTAYAAENPTLIEYRSKIFDESRAIKLLLSSTKRDMVFLSSMWDACIASMTQLDAYFGMVGVFNTIKKDEVTDRAVSYLIDWLNVIKSANEISIKNLEAISSRQLEDKTKSRLGRLVKYYTGLDKRLDTELTGLAALKATARKEKVSGGRR